MHILTQERAERRKRREKAEKAGGEEGEGEGGKEEGWKSANENKNSHTEVVGNIENETK